MTDQEQPRGMRVWTRDLAMGARFAVTGRQGWARTLLTAVGVGIGVALLLFATSVPGMIDNHQGRTDTLEPVTTQGKASASTLLESNASTRFQDKEINGNSLQAEGDEPVLPPGVDRLPKPGEMVVSPALKDLLDSGDVPELVKRFDARVIGTIADDGLTGPKDLFFYQGTDKLHPSGGEVQRVTGFGQVQDRGALPPELLLLGIVACAVFLMPVAVFIATAARFGGERRDQRLAALRLVGADIRMARRVASGEALVGSLLGLALGTAIFLVVRQIAGHVMMFGLSFFPEDVVPGTPLAVLVAVGVPAVSVAVSLFALRGVSIEPLGVVRQGEGKPRRLWWRLAPPVLGMLLLLPLAGSYARGGDGAGANKIQVVSGVILLLAGVALLLPWLVERIVGRLRGGSISWQLAVRRLQISSGTATRAVSGITIAVAGAIALQMLFASAEATNTHETGQQRTDRTRLNITAFSPSIDEAAELTRTLRKTKGVTEANGYLEAYQEMKGGKDDEFTGIVVGSCATLRDIARIDSCRDGQVFRARGPKGKRESDPPPGPGTRIALEKTRKGPSTWTVPATTREVTSTQEVWGSPVETLMVTPSVLPAGSLDTGYTAWVRIDPDDSLALERVRTTLFQHNPAAAVMPMAETQVSDEFAGLRRGIFAGATAVMILIGASMIVTTLEQIRDRKRQLAVLVAFGTRRSTLGASVLWQSAVPVVLGLALASVFGTGLGWALLRMVGEKSTDWLTFLPMAGVGAGLIAVVTLLSLPPLWRMMRPDGLRTE